MNEVQFLEWDSGFFGFKTGKIDYKKTTYENLEQSVKLAGKSGYTLIYLFSTTPDPILDSYISNSGERLIDKKITYSLQTENFETFSSEHIVSVSGTVLNKDLIDLSIESGKYSRFRIDKNFPPGKYEQLYTLWIENSLNGSFADEVFAYIYEKKILGLITLRLFGKEAFVGIISVKEESRGRKIGKFLIYRAISYCKSMGAETLKVQTQQDNKDACYFYERIGFRSIRTEYVYHLWLKKAL
jgi:dTDP-4-amino-4,6-dideoxy-D-galactose acyltransferase